MDLVFLFSLTFDANWVMCASRQGTASKHLACTIERRIECHSMDCY